MAYSSISTPAIRRNSLQLQQLEERALLSADSVLDWHDVALEVVKLDHALTSSREQFGPTKAARALAIVQAAVYDAANSIDRSYNSYRFSTTAAPGASLDAAVTQAAYSTLLWLYPSQRGFLDAAYARKMAEIPDLGKQDGINVGLTISSQMINWRSNDNSNAASSYQPSTDVGRWFPDPLHPNQRAVTPNWGNVTPFAVDDVRAFRSAPPPALNSAEYTANYNELLRLGGDGINSPTERTADQTEAGIYWGYDGQPGLCSPPRLYNQIAALIARQQGNTEIQNARYFALVNLALADVGIACWETKYFYDFWRPITGIRRGAEDGNPDTLGIANWSPLGAPASNGGGTNFTPPFPAYTSGHATFGSALFQTIRRFYGTDDIAFTFVSDEFNGLTFDMNGQVRPVRPRSFANLTQAEVENGLSRIYLGIHWRFDIEQGYVQGQAVANDIFDRFIRRPAESSRAVVGATAGAPHVQVLDLATGQVLFSFYAFDPSSTGGVRVAQGDVNGDGIPDVIAAQGPGGENYVHVYDGKDMNLIHSFTVFDFNYSGGLYIASGDINGDGRDDIIAGAGEGSEGRIKIISGLDLAILNDFVVFGNGFTGGVRVAAGDVDGDGRDDVVVAAGPGGGPHVRVFSGLNYNEILSFFAFGESFQGGVFVTCGDCDGDGREDIIVGSGGKGDTHVNVFGPTLVNLQSYYAFQESDDPKSNGVRVSCVDINRDGRSEIVTTPSTGTIPLIEVKEESSTAIVNRSFAFDSNYMGSIFI